MQEHTWLESDDMEARPWAVDVVHTFSRRKPTNQDLGFVVHIGQMGRNIDHMTLTIDESYTDAHECAEAIAQVMEPHMELTSSEIESIETEIDKILN